MSIEVRDDLGREDWDRYVDAHRDGTPFHRWSWAGSLEEAFGHEPLRLSALDNGRTVGVLPIVAVRSRLTGTRLISTPFAGYGGPIAASTEVADALVAEAQRRAHDAGADHLALHFATDRLAPPSTAGMQTTDLYAAFGAPLPEDPEEILTGLIPAKARRMVRLGIKAGLQAEVLSADPERAPLLGAAALDPGLSPSYDLLTRTMRDLGTPVYPLPYLRWLLESEPERWFVWLARDGKRIAAACWVAAHGDTLYPHFVGADRDYFRVGVSNFLYWSMMVRARENGFGAVDMGRSKEGSGPCSFKKHMGFEKRRLAYRYYLAGADAMPEINPNNPKYSAAISVWRQLPLGIVKLLGPRLIGHFA